MIGCVAEAKTTKITLDPIELEDAIWITKEELLAQMLSDAPTVTPARKGSIAHRLITAWLKDEINLLNGNT